MEQRFIVNDSTAAEILTWARAELAPDPHGSGPYHDAYTVTTRYLDNPSFDTFFRRNSFGRAKYRVRRYGSEDVVFVERKLRTATMLAKRRSSVPLLAMDDQHRLMGYAAWFSRRVRLRQLQPVCLIGYHRIARQLATGGQELRMTVDSDVQASKDPGWSFLGPPEVALLAGQSVVELKYQGHPPTIFKALAERFILVPRATSKYRAAIEALGLAQRTSPSLINRQA